MAGTKEVTCSCKHDEQDRIYGKQRRLANVSENGTTAKCTVCGNKHGQTSKR